MKITDEDALRLGLPPEGAADCEPIIDPASPLAGRAGLRIDQHSEIGKAIADMAKAQELRGCVLISFRKGRIGSTTYGKTPEFAKVMEQLGDRLLAAIDDGKFDPPEAA